MRVDGGGVDSRGSPNSVLLQGIQGRSDVGFLSALESNKTYQVHQSSIFHFQLLIEKFNYYTLLVDCNEEAAAGEFLLK